MKGLWLMMFAAISVAGCESGNMNAPTPLPGSFSDGRPAHAIVQFFTLGGNEVRAEVCGVLALGLEHQPQVAPPAANGQLQGDSLSGGTVTLYDHSHGAKRAYKVGYGTGLGTGPCAGSATTVFRSISVNNGNIAMSLEVETFNHDIIQHTLNPIQILPGSIKADTKTWWIMGSTAGLPAF